MKNFIITLLSAMALSMSAFVFAGGAVIEAPNTDANPAAQVAPTEEIAADATECNAEKEECATEETAAADNTDSPAQVAPADDGEVSDAAGAAECDAEKENCAADETAAADNTDAPVPVVPAEDSTAS